MVIIVVRITLEYIAPNIQHLQLCAKAAFGILVNALWHWHLWDFGTRASEMKYVKIGVSSRSRPFLPLLSFPRPLPLRTLPSILHVQYCMATCACIYATGSEDRAYLER